MSLKSLLFALAAVIAVAGCKEDAPAATSPGGVPPLTGLLGKAAEQAKAKQQIAALPQPDAGKPLSSYQEVESGLQIMFLYVAASRLPPDFTKLAGAFSQEYRETNDSFRKNDLMQAIKPQLLDRIAQAKAMPYGWMDLDDYDGIGAYDFDRKGFPVGEFASTRHRYYDDAYEYKLTWANGHQFAFAPVANETAARQLESMRTNYRNKPRLKIYFFAQSADLNDQEVNALVTRVEITDKSGRVLAEYGPDGSVATRTDGVDEACATGSFACNAAQAAAGSAM